LAKQKSRTSKSSSSSFANKNSSNSNGPQPLPLLLTNEIKFDKQIDIPNPKLHSDGKSTYALFGRSSNNEILPSAITNNAYYPELEKLSNKVNKVFKKKGAKYLLKKQKELNDTSIQISFTSTNDRIFLTYTKPDIEKTRATKNN
jgi:hypothetical protein